MKPPRLTVVDSFISPAKSAEAPSFALRASGGSTFRIHPQLKSPGLMRRRINSAWVIRTLPDQQLYHFDACAKLRVAYEQNGNEITRGLLERMIE